MKLIFLLVVFAVTVVADPPIVFKTDFFCRQHEGRWCAAMYFYELDSTSEDDPVLHFRFCTMNQTKTVKIHVDPLGGDGALSGVFQDYYEIGYKVFHTCSSSGKACSHHKTEQIVPYSTENEQTVHNRVYWPLDSLEEGSIDCAFPKAFFRLKQWYSNPPPMDVFPALAEINSSEILFWTPTKSGTL